MKLIVKKAESGSGLRYVLAEKDEPYAQGVYDPKGPVPGDLYAAAVREALPAADSCFCEIGETRTAFFQGSRYKQGSFVLMQVIHAPRAKEGKGAALSDRITLNGQYALLTFEPVGEPGPLPGADSFAEIRVSQKIRDDSLRRRMQETARLAILEAGTDSGVFALYRAVLIVRTAAETLPGGDSSLADEIRSLTERFQRILSVFTEYRKQKRTGKLASEGFLGYLDRIYRLRSLEEILTDDPELAGRLRAEQQTRTAGGNAPVRLLPKSPNGYDLFTLVNACKKLPGLLGRTVHLKSGAEIILEKTEAMTVIDVNAASSRNPYPQINREAGAEIMRQLRLRNIGGIILCDFINTPGEEEERLTEFLRALAKEDYAACTVYGMTRLRIMEIARKRLS